MKLEIKKKTFNKKILFLFKKLHFFIRIFASNKKLDFFKWKFLFLWILIFIYIIFNLLSYLT